MAVFDKQTAPKELINSPHYHSYSSAAFPTILLFGISSLTSFCLALSLSRSQLPVSLPSRLSPSLHLPYLSLDIFFLHLSLRLRPSLSLSSSSLCLLFLSTSHPRSLLFGQLSLTCLSFNMTSVSFSPEKKEQGAKVSKRILSSQPQALFPHPTLHYS